MGQNFDLEFFMGITLFLLALSFIYHMMSENRAFLVGYVLIKSAVSTSPYQ